MIITLTLNPAIDHTVVLDELVPGDTNRVREGRTDPGGKGINVSRVIRELGQESLAMGFVSGGLGRFIEHTLNNLGIYDDFIHTPGQTRTNLTIIDNRNNERTIISERGPLTDPHHVTSLETRLRRHLFEGSWLVIAGSIPPPLTPDIYARFINLAKERGAYAVLDADGEALTEGVAAQPYLVKPNLREFQRLVGRILENESEILAAARQLVGSGIQIVVVTLGRRGAIAVSDGDAWRAYPPQIDVVSSTGAGDAMLGGLILALSRGQTLPEALQLGTAASAATAETPGTQLGSRRDIERLLPLVEVKPLEVGGGVR